MAETFGLRIEGIEELERALQELGRRTGRAVLERSLRKAAKPMLDAAKANAPFDDGDLEGSLKIARVTVSDPGKAAFAATMRATGGDTGASVAAMRNAYRAEGGAVVDLAMGPDLRDGGSHAHLVEFGTAPHVNGGVFEGTQHPGTAPDPFLRPAFDAQARPTVERLKPILAAEIEKTARRVAARRR